MPTKELSRLQEVIRSLNPRVTVIPYSAITTDGLKEVLEVVQSICRSDPVPVDIDYDRYAAAEAERGWYNGTFRFTLPARTDSYDVALKLIGYARPSTATGTSPMSS